MDISTQCNEMLLQFKEESTCRPSPCAWVPGSQASTTYVVATSLAGEDGPQLKGIGAPGRGRRLCPRPDGLQPIKVPE
eukprot:scaffold8100_cov1250-Prasinococcus_capsulatus_cf.AAC.1